MSSIIFEQSGKFFNYEADGAQRLSSGEVQEVIEMITEYRDNPKMWAS